MNIHVPDFDELVKQEWNYQGIGNGTNKTQLWLRSANMDVTGGKITTSDIDVLANYPDIKSVTISGLNQNTFEHFIHTYGNQLRFIEFFKNKAVEDWSLLGTLPQLECVYWFHNQKITKLWDMSENYALKAVVLRNFTKLHDLSGIEKAPAIEWFEFGDAVWDRSEIESLKPFKNTKIKRIDFYGKKIRDMDISFIPDMKNLEVFNFPSNHFTTQQVAWLVAKCPKLIGDSLKPYIDSLLWNEQTNEDIPAANIVGKRKPTLSFTDNEERISKYVTDFENLVKKYHNE